MATKKKYTPKPKKDVPDTGAIDESFESVKDMVFTEELLAEVKKKTVKKKVKDNDENTETKVEATVQETKNEYVEPKVDVTVPEVFPEMTSDILMTPDDTENNTVEDVNEGYIYTPYYIPTLVNDTEGKTIFTPSPTGINTRYANQKVNSEFYKEFNVVTSEEQAPKKDNDNKAEEKQDEPADITPEIVAPKYVNPIRIVYTDMGVRYD